METKICNTCGYPRLLEDYPKEKRSRDGHKGQCLPCARKIHREKYAKDGDQAREKSRQAYHNNIEKYREKSRKAGQNRRDKINLWKIEHGCKICGYTKCGQALELHHRNPTEKDFNPGNATSWKGFLTEAEKCDVLCANCHRELHAN